MNIILIQKYFVIIGVSIRRIGNRQIRELKERRHLASNLDKDRRIKELEKRLDKIEKSKSQTDDSSEDKNQEPNIPKDNKDSFKASAKFVDDEEEK